MAPDDAAGTDEARTAYQQGRTHYDLGDYDAAIERFRYAFELSHAPALLFNIAQAYRLNKNCARAIDSYTNFLRLTTDAALSQVARDQVQSLGPNCDAKKAPPPDAPAPRTLPILEPHRETPPALPLPEAPVVSAPASRRTRWQPLAGAAALAVGGAALVAAGALYLWDGQRYDTWRTENDALKAAGATGDPGEQIRRRQANDDRWRSVRDMDRVAAGLGLGGAAVLVAGGALLYLGQPPAGMELRVASTGFFLAGHF